MELNFIKEFLQPELMFLVAFLVVIGVMLKTWPKIQNWAIPFILWGVGVVYTVLWFGVIDGNGFTVAVFLNGSVQGTFVTALAVFGYEIVKQYRTKDNQ
jgi:hypothetical protein